MNTRRNFLAKVAAAAIAPLCPTVPAGSASPVRPSPISYGDIQKMFKQLGKPKLDVQTLHFKAKPILGRFAWTPELMADSVLSGNYCSEHFSQEFNP